MADTRPKLSTCPICGFTDTAEDAEALQSAIEEHIRLAHNLDPSTMNLGGDVKTVTAAEAQRAGDTDYNNTPITPIIPVGTNSGSTGAPTAPNAIYATGIIPNEDTLNTPRSTDSEHRNDETDRFS